MKYLLKNLDKITPLLQNNCPKVLLLDFDGTLAPIAKSPEAAILPKETKKLLQSLCQKKEFYLAIISDRQLKDLKEKVGLPNIIYGGNHGFEGEIHGEKYAFPVEKTSLDAIIAIKKQLQKTVDKFSGAFIQNKKLALTLHYRAVGKQHIKQFKLAFNKILKPFKRNGSISVATGKMALEIRPQVNWDKGSFADMIIKKITALTNENPLAIAIGDDKTDEDIFRKLKDNINVTVVKKRHSKAKYYLKDPEEVTNFLKWINSKPDIVSV